MNENEETTGRLNPEEWSDAELTPVPYASLFALAVPPSKLDPVLLAAGRNRAVLATADGLTGEMVGL